MDEIDGFIEDLESDDPKRVKYAIYALGESKDKRAILPLIKALEHNMSNIIYICEELIKIGKPAIPALIEALNHDSKKVRSGATYVLGEIKAKSAVPALIKLLNDKNLSVCEDAIRALGKIRDERMVPALIRISKRKKIDVTIVGEELRNIGRKAVPELIKALKHKNDTTRTIVASVLMRIKDRRAVPALIDALEDKDWQVRLNAVSALEAIISDWEIKELDKLSLKLKSWKLDENADNYTKIKTAFSNVLQAINKRKSELLTQEVKELQVEKKQFHKPDKSNQRTYRKTRVRVL